MYNEYKSREIIEIFNRAEIRKIEGEENGIHIC